MSIDSHLLVERVMHHGGLDRARDAVRALRPTTPVLAERLDAAERDALAHALPRPLSTIVRASEHSDFDLDELYERVRAREGVSAGFAREHAQAVCASLGELLPEEIARMLEGE